MAYEGLFNTCSSQYGTVESKGCELCKQHAHDDDIAARADYLATSYFCTWPKLYFRRLSLHINVFSTASYKM